MDDSDNWLALLLRLAAGVAVIVVAYYLLFGRRADFVIDVRRGRVRCRGKIPLVVQQRLTYFLLEELGVKGSVRIFGAQAGRRLRVWFRGGLTPGEQQRIRNFLLAG